MKIVNCALLYADGDKYVWSVVTEGASEFPIDMDLVADGSIWENDGVKSVLTDSEWVAESSGSGMPIPEITIVGEGESRTYTSTIPYDDMMDIFDGFTGLVTLPAFLNLPPMVTGKRSAVTMKNDELEISYSTVDFKLMPDGTVEKGSR